MMIRTKALLAGLALVLASASAFAVRAYWEEGFYLDDQGNIVGESTIGCYGPERFWGVRTSNFVVTASGSCALYQDIPGGDGKPSPEDP